MCDLYFHFHQVKQMTVRKRTQAEISVPLEHPQSIFTLCKAVSKILISKNSLFKKRQIAKVNTNVLVGIRKVK